MNGRSWQLLGFLALALSACSHESEPDFTYTNGDMNQALLGTWQGTAQLEGESVPFSLSLEQATGKARTETRSRRALPVVGSLTSENPAFNGAVDGSFTASLARLRALGLARRGWGRALRQRRGPVGQ